MDTLTSLRVFVAVADLRSFSAASARLEMSAAMTSKHVQALERRVGARLLNRNSRNVGLTEAGVTYLASVRVMLDGLDDVEARIGDATVVPRGDLKISLPVWMANARFVAALAEYQRTYTEVVLDLDLEGRMVNMVEEGFDLALRGARMLDEGLIARKLTDIGFHLVASSELLERVGRPEKLQDLVGMPLLAYGPVAGSGLVPFEQNGETVEVRFVPVMRSANETMLLEAARAGMGFAISPDLMIDQDLKQGSLERVLPEQVRLTGPLYAVYPNRSYLPAKVRTFLDHMVAKGVFA
ncbi:LysR family transcriptional regulator [Devosia sp. BSSL-BM10]|uniref:LysR family transcriptional regulator n=2 Tax=Devosia TaxID=46913 RepID=A0A942E3L9_9HYPH|nr:LysR family transcriptional regulator [Devosia litorisediminis]MBS3847608.1 LysR family transcriptional regulator [Devosia litorisediminis]